MENNACGDVLKSVSRVWQAHALPLYKVPAKRAYGIPPVQGVGQL